MAVGSVPWAGWRRRPVATSLPVSLAGHARAKAVEIGKLYPEYPKHVRSAGFYFRILSPSPHVTPADTLRSECKWLNGKTVNGNQGPATTTRNPKLMNW